MRSDLRFALRGLWKNRSFTAIALTALALGIGANTALYSVVNRVLLRPLPYPDPDRLAMVWTMDDRLGDGRTPVTPADYEEWRARSRSFQAIAAGRDATYNLTGAGEPEMLIGYSVEPGMFEALGVPAALGRTFERADGELVVVLGHPLWKRRFGSDPAVVGRTLSLDQRSYRVLGVMPEGYRMLGQSEVITPLNLSPNLQHSREAAVLRVVVRLAPGASLAQARAEMSAIAAAQKAAHPATNSHRAADVQSLRALEVGDIEPTLLILLGAVAFVLLLACSNVASLLLARTVARRREIAIRIALGAGRTRLVRQLLVESLLLSLGAGALGLLLAWWGTSFLVQMFPRKLGNVAIPRIDHLPIDGRVLAFSLLISILTGLVFGLAPALAASRTDVEGVLREGATGGSPRGSRLRRWLVAGEIAIAIVLTAGAGLMAASFARLARADLGFQGGGVHTGRVILGDRKYPTPERQATFVDQVLRQLRAQPGVQSAGCVSTLPLSGWWADAGYRLEDAPDQESAGTFFVVEPGYFSTLRVPLQRGRLFEPGDRFGARKVILVDDTFARRHLGGREPLGRRLNIGSAAEPDWREIVGVVGHVREGGPRQLERPTLYVPFAQQGWPLLGFVARGGDAASIRAAVRAVDRDQPVSYQMTMDELSADALTLQRVTMIVLVAFAVLAVGLAALGIYGLMTFAVGQRTREIGIRVALGAAGRDVMRLVLGQTVRLLLIGTAVGLPAALLLARTLRSQLYGIGAADPVAFSGTVLLLLAVALLAAWLPARRASRIDPMRALRTE